MNVCVCARARLHRSMLEVGRMPEHNAAESRSHFSAWAIISSPLTLGTLFAHPRSFIHSNPQNVHSFPVDLSRLFILACVLCEQDST